MIMMHVLIMSVVVLVIATSLARLLLVRGQAVGNQTISVAARRQSEGGFSLLLSAWNNSGQYCASGFGYSCTGTAGSLIGNCACTCTPTAACVCANAGSCLPIITATNSSGRCQLAITTACE